VSYFLHFITITQGLICKPRNRYFVFEKDVYFTLYRNISILEVSIGDRRSAYRRRIIILFTYKKFELMLTRRAKAYSSSGSVV